MSPPHDPPIRRLQSLPVPAVLLLVLWELPQTLLGLLIYALLRSARAVLAESAYGRRRLVRTRGLGVSLGFFVFWFGEGDDTVIMRHELGHALQSAWLGPAYLPAVGAPSILRAAYSHVHAARHGRPWPRYFDGYPESWADRLGGVRTTLPRP